MRTITFTILVFLYGISFLQAQNNCLDLDGINDYVQVNNFSISNDFTISTWFKCNATSNVSFDERMISFGASIRLEIGIENNTNKLWVYDEALGSTQSYGTDLRDDMWHQVAFIKSGSNRLIYLDGVFLGDFTASENSTYGNLFRVGAWTGGLGTLTFFNGQLDETRIWSVAKTENEIVETMSCPITGNEADLLAYWNYDQGIAGDMNTNETVLFDQSINEINGSLNNFNLTGTSSNWLNSNNENLFYLDASIAQNGNEITATTSGLNYQWLDCNNGFNEINDEVSQSFMPTASGSYAVNVSNDFCLETSECLDFTIVGTKSIEDQLEISMYPNPTSDYLFFKKDTPKDVTIMVSNVMGNILLEASLNSNSSAIDLSGLPQGSYFVHLANGKNKVIKKLIKS